MVPKQPLHFGADARCPGRLNYNLRKLSELPHHLLHSGMISELKSSVRTAQQVHHHHHHFICPIIQHMHICANTFLEEQDSKVR